jgi:hypothetical protein
MNKHFSIVFLEGNKTKKKVQTNKAKIVMKVKSDLQWLALG